MERLEVSRLRALPCHEGDVGFFGQKLLLKEFFPPDFINLFERERE